MSSNEVYVRFSIENFTKTHDYITNYLEIQPSKIWFEGDLKTNKGTIKYKNNGWELMLKRKNVYHIDDCLNEIIAILSPKKNSLKALNNIVKKITIIVYSKNCMPSFVFNNKIISFLNDACIELEQDIYCLS